MPWYVRMGQVPPKRHIQFRRPDGGLYAEEVLGTEGFSGIQSILYHYYPPTRVKEFHTAMCDASSRLTNPFCNTATSARARCPRRATPSQGAWS